MPKVVTGWPGTLRREEAIATSHLPDVSQKKSQSPVKAIEQRVKVDDELQKAITLK